MLEKFMLVLQALYAPRKTYRTIQTNSELDASLLLIVITAITGMLVKLLSTDHEMKVFLKILLLVGVLVGAVLTTLLISHLLSWTSDFFKKGDDANRIRLALPYSFVPTIVGNLLVLVTPMEIHTVISVCAGLWAFIVLGFLLAEIKKFSVGKGLVTVLLASLIFCLPIILVTISFSLLKTPQ